MRLSQERKEARMRARDKGRGHGWGGVLVYQERQETVKWFAGSYQLRQLFKAGIFCPDWDVYVSCACRRVCSHDSAIFSHGKTNDGPEQGIETDQVTGQYVWQVPAALVSCHRVNLLVRACL